MPTVDKLLCDITAGVISSPIATVWSLLEIAIETGDSVTFMITSEFAVLFPIISG